MTLWDRICIHACYHLWNPVLVILDDRWVAEVWRTYGDEWPGWKAFR